VIKAEIGKLITYYHRWVEKVGRKTTSNFNLLFHLPAQNIRLVQVFKTQVLVCLIFLITFEVENKFFFVRGEKNVLHFDWHSWPTLLKKLLSRFLKQKHVHCVTRASNFFPKAVLHN
jgi:hypothetical protein